MVLVSIAAIRHCAQNDCDLSDSLACIRIGSTLGSFFFFKLLFFFHAIRVTETIIKVRRLPSLSCRPFALMGNDQSGIFLPAFLKCGCRCEDVKS